jgi:hypothetical protein
MTSARYHMSKADAVTIAAIEAGVPTLVAARTLTDRFHTMIRNRKEVDLVPWIVAASDSLIGSFASGVTKDIAAAMLPWSSRGRTARPKARSPSSNSSSDRCTAEQRSISVRQD